MPLRRRESLSLAGRYVQPRSCCAMSEDARWQLRRSRTCAWRKCLSGDSKRQLRSDSPIARDIEDSPRNHNVINPKPKVYTNHALVGLTRRYFADDDMRELFGPRPVGEEPMLPMRFKGCNIVGEKSRC